MATSMNRPQNGRPAAKPARSAPNRFRRNRFRCRPTIDRLENLVLLSTINWSNPAGGDWDVPGSWSGGKVPGSGDDAVINEPGGITITHSQTTTDTVKSITAHDPVNLSGGTLTVSGSFSDSSTINMMGGTLASATIAAGTTLQSSAPGASRQTSTLQNVTIAGTLAYRANDAVNIAGSGLALSGGSVKIDNGGSLDFGSGQALSGTGTASFTEGSINVSASGKLTIAAGVTLQGGENDFYNTDLNADSGTIDILGTVNANNSGGAGFSITCGSGGSWTNDGTLEATGGGHLNLSGTWTNNHGHAINVSASTVSLSGSWSNLGTLASTGAAVVYLGGTFSLAGLGSYTRDAAGKDIFIVNGTFDLGGGTLNSAAGSGKWVVDGATIENGTLAATIDTNDHNTVGGRETSTFQNVILTGTLKFDSNDAINVTGTRLTFSGATINIDNGGSLNFSSVQALVGTGNILFIEGSLNLTDSGKFTVPAGVTLQGGENDVYNTNLNAGSGTIDILGTVNANNSGGPGFSITSGNGGSWTNDGTLESTGGGHLNLDGTWTNEPGHSINILGSAVSFNGTWSNQGTFTSQGAAAAYLNSTYTLASLGSYTRDPNGKDTFVVGGTFNLSGGTLDSGAGPGKWVLNNATVENGTIANAIDTNDRNTVFYSETSTFQNVTIAGTLKFDSNDGMTIVGSGLSLSNGLIHLDNGGSLNFSGAQVIAGTGLITFTEGSLNLSQSTDVLTIGPGVTLDGKEGDVYNKNVNIHAATLINQGTIDGDSDGSQGFSITSDSGGTLTNQGTLEATNGGTLNVNIPVTSTGSIIARGATVNLNATWTSSGTMEALDQGTLSLGPSGSIAGSGLLSSSASGTIQSASSILGNTTDAGLYAPAGPVVFSGSGTAGSPQLLEAMSHDSGAVTAGLSDNFAYGTLALSSNTYVKLVDQSDNVTGSGAEAVYAYSVVVPSGTTLDLNGLHLYVEFEQIGGTVLHGSIGQVPRPTSLSIGTPLPGSIASTGGSQDATFYGFAGRSYTIVVDPGNGNELAPVSPQLHWAGVQLLDPSGNVLSTAMSNSSGALAIISSATLPSNGTYRIHVKAAPSQSGSTGNYVVTAWDTTVNQRSLELNQLESGQIGNPFAQDQWTFTGVAGQQIQFDLASATSPALEFTLTGPTGFTGFSNANTSSGLINLTASGAYVLTVSGNHTDEGTYAFRIDQTEQTALALGTPYHGTFSGDAQAQLFHVSVPQAQQFLLSVQGISAADHIEIYARVGTPPTRADLQFSATSTLVSSQNLLVPMAAPGNWYILVYAEHVSIAPEGFGLTASVSPITLSSVTPPQLGNADDMVLTLSGAGFDSSTTVSLKSAGGTVFKAKQTQLDLPTELTATFSAGAVPAGVYSVIVSRADGANASLAGAFTVVQGGQANFQVNLITPSVLGYHTPATLYLEYSNTGQVAMPAPIVEISISQTHAGSTTTSVPIMTLDSTLQYEGYWASVLPPGFSNTIELLASGATPGVLEPGESIKVPIYYEGWQQPWDGSYPDFNPQVGVEAATDTIPIPWSTLVSSLQPANLNSTAWNSIVPNLEAQIGSTWGDFVRRLDDDALYLGQLGESVNDLGWLWTYEVAQANGFSPVSVLNSDTDAQVLIVGPMLSVDREFLNSISGRSMTGPLGRGWVWDDAYRNVLSVAPNGTVTITNADGTQRVFEPDSRGGYFAQPGDRGTLSAVSGGGFTLTESTGTITAFNAQGLVSFIADPNGNKITAAYTNGLLTSLTASSGGSLTFSYNSAGLLSTITDSTGQTTTYAYDSSNHYLLAVTDDTGDSHHFTYETSGSPQTLNTLLSVEHPSGAVDNFVYDSQGRLAQSNRNGNDDILTFTYGPAGDVSMTDSDGGTSRFSYDDVGLLAKYENALGDTTHYTYDSSDNLVQSIDAAGAPTFYQYDSNGNLIQTTSPTGAVVSYSYGGPFNRMTSYTDPNGNVTSYNNDGQGDLLSITYANGSEEEFSYNPLGEPTQAIDRDGQAIGYKYNAAGEIIEEDLAGGAKQVDTYDAYGDVTSATGANGEITLQYDPVSHDLLEVTYPGGKFLKFSYDDADRRTQSVDQTGFTVNYSYNAAGLLGGLTDGHGNLIVKYVYDTADRLTEKDMGNGTYTTYKYDPAGDLLQIVNYAPHPAPGENGPVNSEFDYTYDNLGRRITEKTSDGLWTYAYDPSGELTQAIFASTNPSIVPNQNLQYTYDLAGNRVETVTDGVSTSYTTNDLNEYTQIGSSTLSYDANGNLISQTGATGTTAYAYDPLNQLTGVTSPTGTSNYQYDALGDLSASTVNGQTTQYVYDPTGLDNLVGEYSSSGSLIADFTHGLGLTSLINASGGASYYDSDAQGSVAGLSNASGSYENVYRYLPFGGLLTSSESIANPFQYVGLSGVMTVSNGLEFMRARFYAPSEGDFVSPDPLGLAGGQANIYAYTAQNPIDRIDPTGLDDSGLCQNPPGGRPLGFLAGASVAGVVSPAISATLATAGFFAGFIFPLFPPCAPAPPPGPPPSPSPSPGPGGSPGGTPKPNPNPAPKPPAPPKPGKGSLKVPKSADPNSATGPDGFGADKFVAPESVLPYRIDFENKPTATAPAQRVVVTDQLDPGLNLNTLELTSVGFGNILITIPAGSQHFETTVPITENGQAIVVQINIGLNSLTGELLATFQSLNPLTGLPPDVLTGFLPPEDGTGRGMGFFSFIVQAKAGLATGTAIKNVAVVTFDTNPPIATDQVDDDDASKGIDPAKDDLVTIDSVGPTSSVAALPADSGNTFTVSWSGTDDPGGSGITSYNVDVSDNGGPFTIWQANTTATSAPFTGTAGHTYGFYSVATDNVGNVQPTPTAAQATTIVATNQLFSSVHTLPAESPASFTVSWSGNDYPGGPSIASYSIYVSDNGGAFTPFLKNTTETFATFTGSNAHSYGFYSVATDQGGNVQSIPTAAQASTHVDAAPPTSTVAPLPASSPDDFTVSWSGTDDSGGSGIASYSVYVSDNGGSFAPFLTSTTETSATFTGSNGHIYSFYSVATDQGGNVQAAPSAAQATTRVDAAPPTSAVAPLPASSPDDFTVSWSGSDNSGGSGIAGYNVYVSDNGGPFAIWQSGTAATSASYTGVAGHTYGFYSVATDKVGNVQPASSAAQATTAVLIPSPPPLVTVSLVALTLNKKHQVTKITIDLSGAVQSAGADSISAYKLTIAGKRGSFTAKNAKPVKIKSALYSGGTIDSIAITPKKAFALTTPVQLRVSGVAPFGLTDLFGRLIDGNHDGGPGGDAVVVLSKKGSSIAARPQIAPATLLPVAAVDSLLSTHFELPRRRGR